MRLCDIPRSAFYKLNAQQMAVANAMAHRARAMVWMQKARQHSGDIRSMDVAFARAAHAAYRKDIKRAQAYVRHGL